MLLTGLKSEPQQLCHLDLSGPGFPISKPSTTATYATLRKPGAVAVRLSLSFLLPFSSGDDR